MSIYARFAYFYAKGPYPQYSEGMAELLPAALEQFDAQPQPVLDLACGEGTFAVAMAKKGLQVTGVDLSPQMLQFARERAKEQNVNVEFVLQDMRSLSFGESFDLATCWFDSLNYLLELEDLEKTFAGVYRALKKAGLFIFDMNTERALATGLFTQDNMRTNEPLQYTWEAEWDSGTRICRVDMLYYYNGEGGPENFRETHYQRAYDNDEVLAMLHAAGFPRIKAYSAYTFQPVTPRSDRAYYVAAKE